MTALPQLIAKAIAFDHGDARRIQHFLKVYTYADLIGKLEHIPASTQHTLVTAAVLHDIGIHAAEKNTAAPAAYIRNKKGRLRHEIF